MNRASIDHCSRANIGRSMRAIRAARWSIAVSATSQRVELGKPMTLFSQKTTRARFAGNAGKMVGTTMTNPATLSHLASSDYRPRTTRALDNVEGCPGLAGRQLLELTRVGPWRARESRVGGSAHTSQPSSGRCSVSALKAKTGPTERITSMTLANLASSDYRPHARRMFQEKGDLR